MNWQTLLALSGGAFIGVWARWGLMCLFAPLGASWPWAVMSANLLGCLLAGCALGWAQLAGSFTSAAYLFFVVGLLGSFTTFSAFSVDCLRLLQAGAWPQLAAYLAVSVIGGIALAWLGWRAVAH